jgi:drug/metabolite transporter (DMT)-like permease
MVALPAAKFNDGAPRQMPYGPRMIVIIGVLIALAGLVLAGTGGSSIRQARHMRIPIGIVLIVVGLLVAALGGQFAMTLGFVHP